MNLKMKKSILRGLALASLASLMTILNAGSARAQWTTSGTTTSTTNNVGIGTTTPGAKLDVGTGAPARGSYSDMLIGPGGNNAQLEFYGLTKSSAIAHDESMGGLVFYNNGPAWAPSMIVANSGNVGVGTTSPQSMMDISGSTGMTLRNGSSSSGFSFFDRATVPGDQLVFQGNRGNYSLVNVTTKGANIGTEKGAGMAFWTVDIANTANATQFQMQYTSVYGPIFFTQKYGTGAQGDKKISFQAAWQNTANAPSQLVLDTTGNVGVGTVSPATKLHVAGDITVDGNINAKYQDVAEWVPSAQKLAAGTVVVLDPERANHVLASTASYDTAVAGVVSGRPGLALGEAGEGKALVATTGRVKVKVDATRAPIRIGDLLVTGDVEGFAMKSEPVAVGGRRMHAPGTIIGKALEPLDKGTGEILVLLSLQ